MAIELDNASVQRAAEWIRKAQHTVVLTHMAPDGDAMGSALAMYHGVKELVNEGVSELVSEGVSESEIFAANRAKALRELKDKDNRGCQFRTVISLIRIQELGVGSQDTTLQVEGIVRGRIATEEYGEGGFGYDPIFIPEGYDKTFGELPAELKNTISHRARALAELVKVLNR